MWWVLTLYYSVMISGRPQIQTVKLGHYSTYVSCSRAAAQEDTQPSIALYSNEMAHPLARIGLAQCVPSKKDAPR